MHRPDATGLDFADGAAVSLGEEVRGEVVFGSQAQLDVKDPTSALTISVWASGRHYICSLDLREVPSDTHLDAELECFDEQGSLGFKLKLTASLDLIDALVETSHRELEHLEDDMRRLSLEMQAEGSRAAPAKVKKTAKAAVGKKTTAKTAKKAAARSSAETPRASLVSSVAATAATTLNLCLVHRAPVLFLAAAAAIHLVGDFASV